jgi:hypothetical protein
MKLTNKLCYILTYILGFFQFKHSRVGEISNNGFGPSYIVFFGKAKKLLYKVKQKNMSTNIKNQFLLVL